MQGRNRAPPHSGQETRDSKSQKLMSQPLFQSDWMQHPRAKNDVSFGSLPGCSEEVFSPTWRVHALLYHVNTTLQSRQFSGRHDSSPLGFLLIPASSGYGHFFVGFIRGCFVR
ncbi:hypothetical protein N7537_006398 [Penicillium hordei]|uniref:Uncharacterized protein n=1 Tax=Penicillium hordei TaxID=40994 RepID=A0AAD6E8Q1_9EURO|nr:uncharacterized protein N7537_006398 [Penicillium hordei]KAJ5603442.1 hypothetical protein N7537_006398 [Penicillium hordei]